MIQRYAITLAIFAAVTAGITSIFYQITAETIAEQTIRQQETLLNQVIPETLYDNTPLKECYIVTYPALAGGSHKLYLARKQMVPVAMAIEATALDGYAGAIHLLIGVDTAGQVLGVRVTEHHETPGLGDKIELRLSNWIDGFTGKRLKSDNDERWAVRKDGGMFDQFSGATITPRAVVNAVRQTLVVIRQTDLSTLPHCEATP